MKTKKIKIFASIMLLFFSMSFVVFAQNEQADANIIFKSGTNLKEFLKNIGKIMSVKNQTYAMKKYTEPIARGVKGLKTSDKYTINNFIVYGTPSTIKLSAQKRYELIKQYKIRYKKLPINEPDWTRLFQSYNTQISKIIEPQTSSSSLVIELDIRIPKNTFNISESLYNSDYYLKYTGNPFKGLIIYGESREGLIKKGYSATRGTIQTGDFDHPETMPGMKASIYSIKSDGTPNSFDCDGVHEYSISVYDCAVVDKAMSTNDCGAGGWPPTIKLENIVAKVSPLKTLTKTISVVCGDGVANCCANAAYSCSNNKDCISGYSCTNNKCIKN